MDWIAAAAVLVCLVALIAWTSQRWGGPRNYIDLRSPLTWTLAGVIVAAVILVYVIA